MSAIYADPTQISVADGAVTKFRLKNPLKEKFIYHVTISDTDNYMIDIPPYEVVPMGENIQVGISRKKGSAPAPCTVKFEIYKHLTNFPHFELNELGPALGKFEVQVKPN